MKRFPLHVAALALGVSLSAQSTIPPPGEQRPATIEPGMSMRVAITRLARVSNTPIGLEIAASDDVIALTKPLSLDGLAAERAIGLLAPKDAYKVRRVGPAVIIRPAAGTRTFLDGPVTRSIKDGTLLDLMGIVRDMHMTPRPAGADWPLLTRSPGSLWEKKFSASGATLVELLSNALAAHGEALWVVTYKADRGDSRVQRYLTITSFDGTQMGQGLGPD